MENYNKVDVSPRFIAALIDGALSAAVGFIPIIGAIIGTIYMLLRDSMFEGQSLGKKIMKLQVITEEGKRPDYMVSIRRNGIFALPILIMIIPVAGWIIAPILSIVILVIEIMKVLNEPKGRRLGDQWAATQVIVYQEAPQPTGEPLVVEEAPPASEGADDLSLDT